METVLPHKQNKDLYRLAGRINDPIRPHPGLLVQVEFCHPVVPLGGGGKDLYHILRAIAVPLKQPDSKGSGIDLAFLSFQIGMAIPSFFRELIQECHLPFKMPIRNLQ